MRAIRRIRRGARRVPDPERAPKRERGQQPGHQQWAADDEETGLRDGSDFHLALARLFRNPFFADAMSGVLTRLSRTRWLGVRTPEARAQARAEHLDIVLALQARDAALATGLVTAHSRGTRDRLLAYLTEERRRLRGRGLAIIESSATPPPLVPV